MKNINKDPDVENSDVVKSRDTEVTKTIVRVLTFPAMIIKCVFSENFAKEVMRRSWDNLDKKYPEDAQDITDAILNQNITKAKLLVLAWTLSPIVILMLIVL